MSKLKIPNEILFKWLLNKVYHKNSDLLLQYISDNWARENVYVGEYLVGKAGSDMKLLALFIPIVEYISKKTPSF